MKIVEFTNLPMYEGDSVGVVGINADLFIAAWARTDSHWVTRAGATEAEQIHVSGTMIYFGPPGAEPGSRLVKESVEDVLRDLRQA